MTKAFKEIQSLLPQLKGREYIALMVDLIEYIDIKFVPTEPMEE